MSNSFAYNRLGRLNPLLAEDAFTRLDESDDQTFYATDRFVDHLDVTALDTVKKVIATLIVRDHPVILDLMAGWDSHLPENISAGKVVGLGLNANELSKNRALTESVIHDLNSDPTLPFDDNTFDVVLNTVSVDYLTQPIEVFREVNRVLKPGGLFVVIFSNRMFPQKAVKVWRDSGEDERVLLVEDFFKEAEGFEPHKTFISRGKPRPKGDKYYGQTPHSDPIYVVYAEKKGGDPNRTVRPDIKLEYGELPDESELEERKKAVKHTLACPYCGDRLLKWEVPDNPFSQTWDNDYMYICFNDECSYFVRGWDVMAKGANRTQSYRLMYNPEKDCCMPIPVPTPKALREGIIEEND
jgi:SAM-dependent methyltransferase